MDERDVLISRQVALKAAVEIEVARASHSGDGSPVSVPSDVVKLAEDFAGWILSVARPVQRMASDGDPGPEDRSPDAPGGFRVPPDEVPYGQEERYVPEDRTESGFHEAPPAGPPDAPTCSGCNALMNLEGGIKGGKLWSIWRCPNQEKTSDPTEQKRQDQLHPSVWPKKAVS